LGYILPGESANWADDYQASNLKYILYNSVILSWRLIDFGRVFYWLITIFLVFRFRHLVLKKSSGSTTLFMFFAFFLITSLPYLLFFRQPVLHRYLMPANLLLSLMFLYLLFELPLLQAKWRTTLYVLALLGLISGNFWIYPDTVSKGWDATLAHLPYYKLRKHMITDIESMKIPTDSIGSEFPNNRPFRYIDLTNDDRQFPQKDLEKQVYIFQSNIFNDFSDTELYELKHKWLLLKEHQKCGVYVRLYKKPN
jgi:hypothetical protein